MFIIFQAPFLSKLQFRDIIHFAGYWHSRYIKKMVDFLSQLSQLLVNKTIISLLLSDVSELVRMFIYCLQQHKTIRSQKNIINKTHKELLCTPVAVEADS